MHDWGTFLAKLLSPLPAPEASRTTMAAQFTAGSLQPPILRATQCQLTQYKCTRLIPEQG